MAVKFIRKNIPKFEEGGKTSTSSAKAALDEKLKQKAKQEEVDLSSVDVHSDRFIDGSGEFDYDKLEQAVKKDKNLSDHKKAAFARRIKKLKGSNASIDVKKGEDGSLSWNWQEKADRKSVV